MSFAYIDFHRDVLEVFAEAQRRATIRRWVASGFGTYDPAAAITKAADWRRRGPNARAAMARTRAWHLERLVTVSGIIRTAAQWSAITGVSARTIGKRLDAGWGPWRAVHEPARAASGAAACAALGIAARASGIVTDAAADAAAE